MTNLMDTNPIFDVRKIQASREVKARLQNSAWFIGTFNLSSITCNRISDSKFFDFDSITLRGIADNDFDFCLVMDTSSAKVNHDLLDFIDLCEKFYRHVTVSFDTDLRISVGNGGNTLTAKDKLVVYIWQWEEQK